MKKKVLSLLLTLCLAMTFVPMAAFAEGTSVDNWDGSADMSWYMSAPDASAYHISTAEQLAGLAQLVNADPGTTNFAGKTFYLDNDIDLSGHEWISIGTVLGGDYPEYSFCGVFDGKGHVISNLYSHESYIKGAEGADESHNLLRNALFGSVYNGEVKNLGVENADIWIDPSDDSAAGKGILVDWMGKSQITNCWTSGSIYSGTEIEKNIGGIVGVTVQGCTISGCYSTATLTGNFTNSEEYYPPDALPPDTIGGIVGARFDGNLTVTDCWFGGKIIVNSTLAAVGGIVGYADTATVKNCMVVTKDIGRDSVTQEVNTCWVAYALGGTVENCYWPNDAKAYDPSPLAYVGGQSNEKQGTASSNFTSADVLAGLKTNASAGVEWVAGIGHPTFVWDDNNIPANYTAVDAALAKVPADLTAYTDETVTALNNAKANVVRGKAFAEQSAVDAMAKAIEDAIAALQYKGADYTKVDAAIAKANALNKDNYKDFSAVEAAVKAVVRDKNITEQSEVDAMAKAIEDAITGLVRKSSGSSRPRYDVTTPSKPENGSVTVDPERARSGSRVTVTVTPDSGYKLGELVVTDKDGKKLELTDKGNGQYTFTMPSGKVEVAAEFVKEVEVSPFADVETDAYYYDAVKWAVNKGITNGVSETLFGPDQACTRAQIVTFLWRAAGSPEPKSGSSFADVAADAYYAKAVAWAVENGITKGTSETTFHPDETCTRAQGVTFLYRALGKLAAAQAGFTDVAADSYYADAVNWAAENGVTNGISETLFGPDGSCTRAQIVTFLYRAYQGK